MTLIKYLLKKFIPIAIGSVFFFSLTLVLVDLFMNLWEFIAQEVPVSKVFYIMFLYIPKTVFFAVPLGILFASSYVISDLYAKNELTSIFASGISLFRFTLPLLILSFFISIGMFWFENIIVVPTFAKKNAVQTEVLKKEKSKNNDKIVVLAENSSKIYKADYYDDRNKRLYGVYIVLRNPDKSLSAVLRADSAFYKDDSWSFVNALVYSFIDGTVVTGTDISKFTIDEPPETFQSNVTNIETENTKNARVYLDHLRRTGLPSAEAKSQYYKKYSYPFVVFIVVFLSIGLSGKTRKNVLLISLVLCLGSAVAFYVTQMVTMLLAKFGYIPPLTGAWMPIVLFTIISIIFLRFART